jgi:hypothetical protein
LSPKGAVTIPPELETALTEAIEQTRKSLAAGMTTINGDEARPQLERLANELKALRDRAIKEGTVEQEWIQKTVRWLVEWVPDSELTLIAAIGRIARSTTPNP